MALWIGIYPKPFFQILEQPVNQIVQNIRDNSKLHAPVIYWSPHRLTSLSPRQHLQA